MQKQIYKKINKDFRFPTFDFMTATSERGAAMMVSVIFFVVASAFVVLGLTGPSTREYKNSNDTVSSKQSYFLGESGVEDAYYRIKNGMAIGTSENLVLGSSSVTTTITDLGGGQKQIKGVGDVGTFGRSSDLKITTGTGVSFNYGMQAGEGGIVLSGSSGINGNVYTNGNITGSGSPFITGTVTAANSAALTADQTNGSGTPSYNVTFGNTNSTQDMAQSFQVSTSGAINKFAFYIKKNGAPSNATVKIVNDSSGSPGTTVYTSGTLNASLVTTSYGWIDVTMTNSLLVLGTTYWVVIDASTSSSNYYIVGANLVGYSSGIGKIGQQGGTWNATSPSGLDIFFSLYLGGYTSTITGAYASGFAIGGNAHAHTVNNSSVTGTLKCQTGTGNNKSCNTSYADPSPIGYPISDANIAQWESDAAAGGTYTGNYTLSGSGTTLYGPKKIVGNLIVGGSTTLKMTGTLYVTGYVDVSGSAKIVLDSTTYGHTSGIIISDGYLNLGGSGTLNGTGLSGSYILFITNSTCPNATNCSGHGAIDISGSAGSVVLNAQKGTINFSGSSSAKEATAYKLSLSGSTTVTYDSGLVDMDFTSGPTGSYSIDSWKESN